jgi:FAD/FMN-containing dehydrogenase
MRSPPAAPVTSPPPSPSRAHDLRLVVKGGGHSYQGGSASRDSLLLWMRHMEAISLHDAFTPEGCAGRAAPRPAVSVGAGVIWGQVYDAVTNKGGRYVQGGGCLTVGVAGLVQSGGFGSFSKAYGLAAASLLEAEIVTADGAILTVNDCNHPDLFWALKGGGGGSFGAITRLTLATHELPAFFGTVNIRVQARSDAAYRRLVGRWIDFYAEALFNPHWGEQVAFRPDNRLSINMLFQGIDQAAAQAIWRPFLDWLGDHPDDFSLEAEPVIFALPARRLWDQVFLKELPDVVMTDDRPNALEDNIYWAGDAGQAGQFIDAYHSTWLPASLLEGDQRDRLAEATFQASRSWGVNWHVNKGLAGASAATIDAAHDTAINPVVLDAFALVIIASEQPLAYPGMAGHAPDVDAGNRHAGAVRKAMTTLRDMLPTAGSYYAESDYFEPDWQDAFWGWNYPRLVTIKRRYDPDGLFFVRHGPGSEGWSDDGFSRFGTR